MFTVWMVNIHSIKFTFYLVLGVPPPILAISGNISLWFLDRPGLKIVKSLNITLFGVPFLVLVQIWVLLSRHPCTVARTEVLFLFNLDRQVVSAIILAYLGSVLVHYFSATMLFTSH